MAITDFTNELSRRLDQYWNPPSWRNLFITFPWVIGLIFFLYGFVLDHKVAGREQTTYGIIRTHEPANHNRFGYEFPVNGKLYTGSQIPAREYEIGQRVLVYYDPLDPTTNSLESFAEAADRSLGPIFLLAIGITGVVVVIFVLRRDHARKNRQHNAQ